MIRINNLSYSVASETGLSKKIFSGINFTIEKFEWVGILAPYGIGKSVLLKSISNLLPYNGEVLLGSEKDNAIFIPAAPSSFQWMNVKQNVAFAEKILNQKISASRIKELISLVGLDGYEEHTPHPTSHAFRFRISFARSLALNPALIAIDEVLSEMKPESKLEIIELMKSIKEKKIVSLLYASSNVNDVISFCDKVILLGKKPAEIIGETKITGGFSFDQKNILDLIKSALPNEKGISI